MAASRKKLLVAVLLVLAFLVPIWLAFDAPGSLMDEATLLVYPEMVLKGKVPYRDFETFYGPANIYLLAASYKAFGASVFVERSVGLIYRLLLLAAFFTFIQRWGTTLAAGCSVIAGFVILPLLLPAFAWLGGIACALWGLWSMSAVHSARRSFFGGMLAAAAMLFRPDQGPAVLLSALPLFLLMEGRSRRAYAAGAGAGLSPLAIITVLAGPTQILQNFFIFPVLRCSPGRHLPLSSASEMLLWILALHVLATAVNVTAGIIAVRREPRSSEARLFLALGLLGLGLTHQAIQRVDFTHLAFTACISLPMLPVSIARLAFCRRAGVFLPSRGQVLLSLAAAYAMIGAACPIFANYFQSRLARVFSSDPAVTAVLTENGRSYPLSSPKAAAGLAKLLDVLQKSARPGQRLFVGPADLRRTNLCDTYLYHLLPQLTPATYFLEMNPLSANRPNSPLASDVASADWLILNHAWDQWSEPNESSRYGSAEPGEVVRTKFELRAEQVGYELYQRKNVKSTDLIRAE